MIPRWAILRGDAAALGIAGIGVGAVLIALAAGTANLSEAGIGTLSIAAGAALLQHARAAWRAEIARVADRYATHDPGPSPVPWVSDHVWRATNRFDPSLDAINELVAEIDPAVPRFADAARGGLEGPVLRWVQDVERTMAPTPEPVAATATTPQGSAEVLQAALQGTPGRLIGVGVRWPVCCGHLSVLTDRDPTAPMEGAIALGDRVTAPPPGEASPYLPHRFRCPACGRRYATEPDWGS